MRTVLLLPLTAALAVVAGCGSEGTEQATLSLPERDLTLATQAPKVEIASPVELQKVQTPPRSVRPSGRTPRRPTATAAKPAAITAAPAPILAASQPVAERANPTLEPANDRELLPGETVTVLPVSSGPSPAPEDWLDERPTARGGDFDIGDIGGRCPRRGRIPDIGIAAIPLPEFR